jgi:hypothetical protein
MLLHLAPSLFVISDVCLQPRNALEAWCANHSLSEYLLNFNQNLGVDNPSDFALLDWTDKELQNVVNSMLPVHKWKFKAAFDLLKSSFPQVSFKSWQPFIHYLSCCVHVFPL